MSSSKWLPAEMRGFKKRGKVWWLYLPLSKTDAQALGKKHEVHRLGNDLAQAIKVAKQIRGNITPPLDELAESIRSEPDEEARHAIAGSVADRFKDEAEAVRWYKQATGQDVNLYDLAEHNRAVISQKTYQSRIDALKRTGLKWSSQVTTRKQALAIIDGLLESEKLSRSTVSLTARTLSTIWQIGIDKDLLISNPFGRMNVKVPQTEKRALLPPEAQAVAAFLGGTRAHSLFVILAITGMRVSEALSIKSLEPDGTSIRITKSKTPAGKRTIPLSHRALEAMQRLVRRPITYEVAHTMISKAYRELGIENADVHSLRRTASQAMLECGVPEPVAASIIGHRSKGGLTFGLYATQGPNFEMKREALEKVEAFLFGT